MKSLFYCFLILPFIALGQAQADCSFLTISDITIQNDSITFDIYNADTIALQNAYVAFCIDGNGDTIQNGLIGSISSPAQSTNSYEYPLNFSSDSIEISEFTYPLNIKFVYANLNDNTELNCSLILYLPFTYGCTNQNALNYQA